MSNIFANNIKNISGGGNVKINQLSGIDTAGSILITGEGNNTSTNLQQGLCKHWIAYDHDGESGYSDVSGTTLRDSFNTSSVTDATTGVGEPNFTNNMSNTKYAPVLNAHYQGSTADADRRYSRFVAPAKFTTGAYAYGAQYVNGSSQDNYITSHVTGDLA